MCPCTRKSGGGGGVVTQSIYLIRGQVSHVIISALCTSVLQALETCELQWLIKLQELELSMMKRLKDGEEEFKREKELLRE